MTDKIIIIAKNNSGSQVEIEDLGIFIDDGEQNKLNESVEPSYAIYDSDDLKQLVLSGTLVIYDGTEDLNAADGVVYLDIFNKLQLLEEVKYGTHTPAITNATSNLPKKVDIGSDLEGNSYNIRYSLSNTQNVQEIHLVGFNGKTHDPASKTTISTSIHIGSQESLLFTFPGGADFSDDGDFYTIRIEIYSQGQTPATDFPAAYHDFYIEAGEYQGHELVHFGFVGVDEDKTDIDFVTTDIATTPADESAFQVTGIPTDETLHRFYFASHDKLVSSMLQSEFELITLFDPFTQTIGGHVYHGLILKQSVAINSEYNGTVFLMKTHT